MEDTLLWIGLTELDNSNHYVLHVTMAGRTELRPTVYKNVYKMRMIWLSFTGLCKISSELVNIVDKAAVLVLFWTFV